MRTRTPAPKPGIYHGVPMSEYLAWDAWSKSDVAKMQEGPEVCRHHRDREEEDTTAATSFGSMAHTALLEPHAWPPKDVVWIPGPWNTNPMRADRADALARGLRVEKPEVRDEVTAMAQRARQHPWIARLLAESDIEREVCAVAKCPVSGLTLKARCDLKAEKLGIIGDLKTTTAGTDPRSFNKQAQTFDYWLGASHYLEVFSLAAGVSFDVYLFLVVGQAAPYSPRVYAMEELSLNACQDLNHYLRRKVAACIAAGEWPSPHQSIESLAVPSWFLENTAELLRVEAANA